MTEKRNFRQNAYYHVIMRGNNRRFIFRTKEDMRELERALMLAYLKYPFKILAYCFMTNHYHLLIRAEKDPLSKIMAVVNRRYSDSYSSRYGHIGRIYQKRYFAKEVDGPLGLLTVSNYIHRNPIETMIPMVTELTDYPYSSYPLYANDTLFAPPYLDRNILKELLPHGFEKTNAAYARYCLEYRVEVEEDRHVPDGGVPEF